MLQLLMILFSTLYEELSFPLENLGYEESVIKEKAEWALTEFDLTRYKEVSTAELSGGEKKRLMIAILFLIDPELYILDESFDELSPFWRAKIAKLIKERGRSVLILGSHFLPTYEGLYDRVITIKDGKAAPYERETVSVSLVEKPNGKTLSVKDIALSRPHRSLKEENPFSLDVSSFSIEGGKCTLLLGENGSGKSTLSKVLCGLLKEERGTVKIDDKLVAIKERRREVAYLMQNPFEQLFLPTVKEDIERALELFSLSPDWYISEIPYGSAKLVQAAVFYLLKRPFAIFDELDSALSYSDSLKAVNAYLESGTGLLIITHDEYFASLFKGKCYRIEGGKI